MRWTISNILTLLRVALIPVIVTLYLGGASGYLTAGVFLLAGVTDWADGFLARQLNEESPFGAFLDPVADKLMVSAVLVLMAADPQMRDQVHSPGLFTIIVAIIIGREITVSALREWMAELGRRGIVAVGGMGKVKTTLQFIAITVLLFAQAGAQKWAVVFGEALLYAAGTLTLWSMVVYLRGAWPSLSER
ncbi:MAG: CDP-diacylglycerol--glycerol-3-phosphate 3-phosphatidyltransferase [Arenicellales bacterium]|tara:strand:- start:327 stop:899 length:573 start_codon:yes stop_codon:yes gene_type:complete